MIPRHIARHLLGLLILLAFLFAGEAIARFGRLPLPGSVAGMLMLAGALRLRWIPPSVVEPAAELLIRNMALFFVPAGVGVMTYAGLLRREWLPVVAGAVASTVAVLLVVGWMQQRLERDG
ncbi:MAG TPA: CidA/LrgA family protein [Longimicrobium sp.]|jgi:holin-like protein|uniref:CidA/LrgA family protein n=1 Tax=Longimicrobium sp. TaxID=2029185 RepID=UPI002ED7AEA5